MPEYTRESYDKYPDGRATHYRALGKVNPETGRVPYASVGVFHNYAKYAPTFSEHSSPNLMDFDGSSDLTADYLSKKHNELLEATVSNRTDSQRDALDAFSVLRGYKLYAGRNTHHEDPVAWAVGQTRTNPHIAPDQLFIETEPASIDIKGMHADPSMKTAAINLLGVAYDESNNAPFVSDSSLTKFSSRLTQNAINRGLPVSANPNNPEAKTTAGDNEESTHLPRDMSSEYAESIRTWSHPVSDLSLIRGKEAVREILGRKRNTKPVTSKGLSDQFLPGMEGFV